MEEIFNRYRSYRSLIVLVVVLMAQLLYLAYQVRTARDERLIRVWAVSAVTPFSGIVEAIRHNTIGFMHDYFLLLDVRKQNLKLKQDNDELRMQTVFLRNQLSTAEHAHALTIFQAKTPSKTVAARVVGDSTVSTAKAVFIDRGSTSGVEKGMAVVTPDGIVGKVVAVYPLVSQVLLVTDSTFKVGVESQKKRIHGSLNCGSGHCVVEQIQNEEEIAKGEWFYTSGEDRIFPKGFPVGTVVAAQPGNGMKDIRLNLSGSPGGAEEVLVILDGVHQVIPAEAVPEQKMAKPLPPPPEDGETAQSQPGGGQTEADKLLQKYQKLGKDQNHAFGAMYSNMPNFNAKPPAVAQPPQSASPATATPGVANAAPPSRAPLGSSPAPGVANTKPAAPRAPAIKPALPLGSPRPKPAGAQQPNASAPGRTPAAPPQ